MLYIDKKGLENALAKKGLTVNALAVACGISRQSIYQMFEGRSVFNTSFEKVLKFLNCPYQDLVREVSATNEYVRSAPPIIRSTLSQLQTFAEKQEADLFILNPVGKGRFGFSKDWGFGLYFPKKDRAKRLAAIRQEILSQPTPYRIEIINLNRAPAWRILSIKDDYIKVAGTTPENEIFERKPDEAGTDQPIY